MRNILVVSVNWLGDVVFSTPVYRALKVAYPSARITALAVKEVSEILKLCPDVDDVIVYDEKRSILKLFGMLETSAVINRKNFDAVFILRRSLSRSLMVWMAGIPIRVGFKPKGPFNLLTHTVDHKGCDLIHRRDVYLRVIESFGVKVVDRFCYLDVDQSSSQKVDMKLWSKGLPENGRVVVIHSGANWQLKQWSPDFFAELTARLMKEFGLYVVLSGSKSDLERVRYIAQRSGVNPIVLAGETDLKQLAALFKRSYMVVSADSGPLHVASAVGANVVALFGPTRPEITGPCGQGRIKIIQKDVGCNKSACYKLNCSDNRCMKAITVDDVLQNFQILKT